MKTDKHVWMCFGNKCFACTGFSREDEKTLRMTLFGEEESIKTTFPTKRIRRTEFYAHH